MASKFPAERDKKVKLHTRKGHDMTWSCDIHGEPIKFYCQEHKIPICHPCTTKDHLQKPCELDDIGDVILEMRRKMDDKRHEIEKTKKTLDSKLEPVATFLSNHFLSVNDELKVISEDNLKSVKDKEGDNIRSINEEADDEIRIINKRREKRIKSCNEEAEQQQFIINESHEKVLSETKAISKVVSEKIKDLTSKNQHAIIAMDNIDAKIKRIEQDDKTLVNETPQVLASLDENLIVHQDVSDCLDRIQLEVQKVKFVEDKEGGEYYGRIDGYIGKWELVKSIHIPLIVNNPRVCGLIRDDEICVRDVENNATYVTNTSTKHTQKIIERDCSMYITSCAPLDSNVIALGKGKFKRTNESLDGCITLHDRQWKMVRDISIPWKTPYDFAQVYIDVDRDGMILAAQCDQSNIYVINPADGKIVSTITMQGKVVEGEIQALSSRDIVVSTGGNRFTVISRPGEEKAAIHCDEWTIPRCRVDKRTDTLYITYCGKERTIYAVDQVSCDGIIQARRIVEYEQSDRNIYKSTSPCLVTPTGNLVACNGEKLFVYKKRFIV